MIAFRYDPPLPEKSPASPTPFMQTITMTDEARTLGVARWHSPADTAAGLVQVLDLTVFPPHQRVGNGRRLMDAVIAQGRELQRCRHGKLRRVWIGVEQKSQVIARAFLTSRGFHHIATVDELYRDQELMVYVKSMD